jgi:hypothetical protein
MGIANPDAHLAPGVERDRAEIVVRDFAPADDVGGMTVEHGGENARAMGDRKIGSLDSRIANGLDVRHGRRGR